MSAAVTGLLAFGAGSALAVPGDRAIDDPAPGEFRLDSRNLEPGCFSPRFVPSNIDLSSFDLDVLPNEELRVSNNSGSMLFSYNIDQILVPGHGDGYRVYNSFNRHGADIAPGEQEGEMFAPGDGAIENDDVILCVSDESAPQNEPYQQEDGGLVSAKNRPILAPKVTGIGASAVAPLNTYKVGFGYDTEQWYTAPTFDGHGLFPAVTDPEAALFGSDGLPNLVRLNPRPDDFPYDARRVNDVDGNSEAWYGPDLDGDADFSGLDNWFRRAGDDRDAIAGDPLGGTPLNLIATLTQGDLPLEWTLRPSLASPDNLRSVTFTDDDLRAWDKSWQDYYDCKAPKPSMPLLPGTNSPASDDGQDCNPQLSAPAPTVVNPTPTVVVNPTPVVVQAPAAAAAPKAAVKKVTAKQRAAYKRCVKKAKAKHSRKARSRAKARCARMPH